MEIFFLSFETVSFIQGPACLPAENALARRRWVLILSGFSRDPLPNILPPARWLQRRILIKSSHMPAVSFGDRAMPRETSEPMAPCIPEAPSLALLCSWHSAPPVSSRALLRRHSQEQVRDARKALPSLKPQ